MTADPFAVPPPLDPSPAAPRPGKRPPNRAAADRFGEINAFVDVTLADLDRGELVAWLVLWRDARHGIAQTSLTEIARRGGMSRRTAADAVKALLARGLIRQRRKGGPGQGASSYHVRPIPPQPASP